MIRKLFIKIVFYAVVAFLISNIFITTQSVRGDQPGDVEEITVGIYNGAAFGVWGVFDWEKYCDKYPDTFPYLWAVGDKRYKIEIVDFKSFQSDQSIDDIRSQLEDIDVLLIDGASNVGWGSIKKILYEKISTCIKEFIEEQGKGYIGYCGGSYIALKPDISVDIDTWAETNEQTSLFDDDDYDEKINARWLAHTGTPVLDEHFYPGRFLRSLLNWKLIEKKPENIGMSAWTWLKTKFSGAPMNLKIKENEGEEHPILKDYHGDNILIGWAGGPAFSIDYTKGNSDITNLAYYKEDLSEDPATEIGVWSSKVIAPNLAKILIFFW